MPAGRPTDYTLAKAQRICELLLTFDEEGKPHSLRKICEIMEIGTTTLFGWFHKHKEFAELYTQARQQQADLYADLRIDVAWENPQVKIPTKNGSYSMTDAAGINRNRLRFDAMTKHAGQLNPHKYGDKPAQPELPNNGNLLPLTYIQAINIALGYNPDATPKTEKIAEPVNGKTIDASAFLPD